MIAVLVTVGLASACGDDAAKPELIPTTTSDPSATGQSDDVSEPDDDSSSDDPGEPAEGGTTIPAPSTTDASYPTTTYERRDPNDPDYPVAPPPAPPVTYPDS